MSKSILIVDDDDDFVSVTTQLLVEEGYRVCSTTTLASARRMAARNNFAAAIVDLMLPDGTGIEFLDTSISFQKIIFVTGHPNIKSLVETLSGPSISFLKKPTDFKTLLAAIRGKDRPLTIREVERRMIVSALEKYESKRDAAKSLGISLNTLYNRINAYGIECDDTGTFRCLTIPAT